MDRISDIANCITEDPNIIIERASDPIIHPDIIRRCSSPDGIMVIHKLYKEIHDSEDEDTKLRKIIRTPKDLLSVIQSIQFNQCMPIHGTSEDAGPTYLEQQIGGVLTFLFVDNHTLHTKARYVCGMDEPDTKTKEEIVRIVKRRKQVLRRRAIRKMQKHRS